MIRNLREPELRFAQTPYHYGSITRSPFYFLVNPKYIKDL